MGVEHMSEGLYGMWQMS